MKSYRISPLFTAILLLILYLLSYIINININKPEYIKSALINKKYEEKLNTFNFQYDETNLFFLKKDNIWFVNTNNNEDTFLPADSKKVNNFIKDLTKVVNMYKISDRNNSDTAFFADNDSKFILNYDNYSIYFGKYDVTQTLRYISTNTSNTIFQIETSLDKYLTTSLLAWTEPYILSRQIVPVSDNSIQSVTVKSSLNEYKKHKPSDENYKDLLFSFMELRHGGTISNQKELSNLSSKTLDLFIECGDTSEANIEIFNTNNDSEYIVKTKYKSNKYSKNYVFYSKISSWTYNRIKEIML